MANDPVSKESQGLVVVYKCDDCDLVFDGGAGNKKKSECPSCGSKKVKKVRGSE